MKALLLTFVLASWPSIVQGQILCYPREVMVMVLSDKYGEVSIARGIHHQGPVIEIYASAETTSWSLVATNAQGVSCLLGSGESWHPVPANDIVL